MRDCRALILDRIRLHGPVTFAEFMDIALYDPEAGYYATATRRSGRGGDFYTSVDVGPVFGEFLARQFAEMIRLLSSGARGSTSSPRPEPVEGRSPESGVRTPDYRARAEASSAPTVDLVEAGAGNGRLARDVLDALERSAPDVYKQVRLRLVERSAAARAGQMATLGRHASKLSESSPDLPGSVHGILYANELLDALPTHLVVGRNGGGLNEIVIDADGDRLIERERPAAPAIEQHLAALGVRLPAGWRAEVNLEAIEWVRCAARALARGFLVLVDYGDEATALYSAARARGTLTTFTGHVADTFDDRRGPSWLESPGACDITAHVDFTSIRNVAVAEGLEPICLADQMHFLLGLGVEDWLVANAGPDREQVSRRLALKTLLVPGGLGTTHHVMMFGRNVGHPALKGCR